MDRATEGNSGADMAGVAGLIGVRSDRYFYVGKVDGKKSEEVKKKYGHGYVPLKDAYEIIVQHKPLPDGRLQVAVLDLPIFPNEMAGEIIVRADAVIDMSRDPGMAKIHAKMTGGRPGILIPGSAGPLR